MSYIKGGLTIISLITGLLFYLPESSAQNEKRTPIQSACNQAYAQYCRHNPLVTGQDQRETRLSIRRVVKQHIQPNGSLAPEGQQRLSRLTNPTSSENWYQSVRLSKSYAQKHVVDLKSDFQARMKQQKVPKRIRSQVFGALEDFYPKQTDAVRLNRQLRSYGLELAVERTESYSFHPWFEKYYSPMERSVETMNNANRRWMCNPRYGNDTNYCVVLVDSTIYKKHP